LPGCASSPEAASIFGPQILVDDLVEEPLRFADFRIHLPAGPGLGVTLDQDKLRRYARP
jgi:muconate cycloisomerase